MKQYNCPDCDMNLLDCSDCPRVYAHNKRNTNIDVDWSKFNISTYENLNNIHANTLCDLLILNNYRVNFIDGELTNFKITYKEDLDIFKTIISNKDNKN